MGKIRAGIVGFSGYSGQELVRLLTRHPDVEPVLLEHREQLEHERPTFDHGLARLLLSVEKMAETEVDAVLLATHHDVSVEVAPAALAAGKKVVDLSAGYRLRTLANYERWYKYEHPQPELLTQAAYGLPEFFRNVAKGADLIANPGCYPTACNLALRPLIVDAVLDRSFGVVCDAKSGVSGAGRAASLKTHLSEAGDNFSVYGILFHRHTPEILLTSDLQEHELFFTAQLLPLHRGILETIYVRTAESMSHGDLYELYQRRYADEPFVRIYPEGRVPSLRDVQNTNFCDIGFQIDSATKRVMIVAAIDNLLKGAAGQAVQNLNLMFGYDETAGIL